MRCAKPSTIAVLPTPGSPIRTGIVLLAAGEHLDRRLDLARAADYRVELAFARKLGEITRVFVEVRRVGRRFDLSFLGAAADHLHHLLADRLRRQPIAAQNVAGDALLLLGEPDQEMLGADIGMAKLVRGSEGVAERALHARRDADLAALRPALRRPAAAAPIELTAEVVE